MKKIIILLPVYNDWESLLKVLDETNSVIKDIQRYEFECIIVNDSSTIKKPEIVKPKKAETGEYALMIDTRDGLTVADLPNNIEDDSYLFSWLDQDEEIK